MFLFGLAFLNLLAIMSSTFERYPFGAVCRNLLQQLHPLYQHIQRAILLQTMENLAGGIAVEHDVTG